MKRCFKCGVEKDEQEFYRHPMMADGRLGKCKECAKTDSKNHWVAKREDYRRYDKLREGLVERKQRKKAYQQKRRMLHPDKYRATTAVHNAIRDKKIEKKPCEVCGAENVQAHHADYSKPLNVSWLCFKHHRQIHGQSVASEVRS